MDRAFFASTSSMTFTRLEAFGLFLMASQHPTLARLAAQLQFSGREMPHEVKTHAIEIGGKMSRICSSRHARLDIIHPHLSVADRNGDGAHLMVVARCFIPSGSVVYIGEPYLELRNRTQNAITLGASDRFISYASLYCTMSDEGCGGVGVTNQTSPIVDSDVMASLYPRTYTPTLMADDVKRSMETAAFTEAEARRMSLFFNRVRLNAFRNANDASLFLYHFGSFFNHSCEPNTRRFFSEDPHAHTQLLHVVATRNIAPGDEVTISYDSDRFTKQYPGDVQRRRALLRLWFHFDCHCLLCETQLAAARPPDE